MIDGAGRLRRGVIQAHYRTVIGKYYRTMPTMTDDVDANATAVDGLEMDSPAHKRKRPATAATSAAASTASAKAMHAHPSGGLTSWQRMSGNLPLTEMSFWGSALGGDPRQQ
jgi:hypothetical protein